MFNFKIHICFVLIAAFSQFCVATAAPIPRQIKCGMVSAQQRIEKKNVAPVIRCVTAPCPQPAPKMEDVAVNDFSIQVAGKKIPFHIDSTVTRFEDIKTLNGKNLCIEFDVGRGHFMFVQVKPSGDPQSTSDGAGAR